MKNSNYVDVDSEREIAIFETMDYMEDKIKDAIEYLMEQNKKDLEHSGDNLYCEGYRDALVSILYELEIKFDIDEYNLNG